MISVVDPKRNLVCIFLKGGYPLNASDPYILLFPSTSCRYGTAVVATACCIRR